MRLLFTILLATMLALSPIVGTLLVMLSFGHVDSGFLLTIATVELALSAVFQIRFQVWIMRPKLDLEIRLEPPCFHQVPIRKESETPIGSSSISAYPVYYYRVLIWNRGNMRAEKVEVLLTRVYKYREKKFERETAFPIDNLVWSTIGTKSKIFYVEGHILKTGENLEPAVYCDYISPGTYKLCTLGHIWDPQHRDEDPYGKPSFEIEQGRSTFCFDVSFKSNIEYYHLQKGNYGIEIQIAAANAKVVTKRFKLEVTGNWFPHEATMLKEGLRIEEVKGEFDDC